MSRTKLAVSAAATIVLAAAAVGLWQRHGARLLQAAQAERLLAEADELVAAARREKLVPLAARSFADVEREIGRGRTLLAEARGHESVLVATAARDAAIAARNEALGLVETQRTASLARIVNQVLHRPGGGVAWSDAAVGMDLFDGDRIATKEQSRALIRFEVGTEMRLEADSVVVVKRFTENVLDSTLDMELKVTEGSVRTFVAADGDRDVRLSLVLPQADIFVDTSTLDDEVVELKTEITADKGSRIAVYSGEVEVETAAGDSLKVEREQFAEINARGELTMVDTLPPAAMLLDPDQAGTVFVSPFRPNVTFRWQRDQVCQKTRVEVSTESVFMDKRLDQTTERAKLRVTPFEDGDYLWRISCIGQSGAQGPYSPAHRFRVVHDARAPRLTILEPTAKSVVRDTSLEARCRTESSVLVFINGERAKPAGNGEYTRVVSLEPGLNRIVFEAIDAAGNASHARQFVTRAE